MIEYRNKLVVMALVDLEHCGFDIDVFHAELQMAGIEDEAARWPVALLVDFAGGAVITPDTSAETLAWMEEAGRQFQNVKEHLQGLPGSEDGETNA